MKKTLVIIFAALVATSAVGCGKKENDDAVSVSTSKVSTVSGEKELVSTTEDTQSTEKETQGVISQVDNSTEVSETIEEHEKSENSDFDYNDDYNSDELDDDTERYYDIAYSVFQSGMDMYSKVILSSPFRLDYDNSDSNGFVAIADDSITSVDDIVSLYCTVFAEPNNYIYERYVESNGKVYCNDSSRGANRFYTDTELEYVSGDESEMTFNAVSHYIDSENDEAMDDKVSSFTIKLEDGDYLITEFSYPK